MSIFLISNQSNNFKYFEHHMKLYFSQFYDEDKYLLVLFQDKIFQEGSSVVSLN